MIWHRFLRKVGCFSALRARWTIHHNARAPRVSINNARKPNIGHIVQDARILPCSRRALSDRRDTIICSESLWPSQCSYIHPFVFAQTHDWYSRVIIREAVAKTSRTLNELRQLNTVNAPSNLAMIECSEGSRTQSPPRKNDANSQKRSAVRYAPSRTPGWAVV